MKKGEKTNAAQLRQFDNPVTLGILIILVTMCLGGLYLCYVSETWTGRFTGLISVLLASLAWMYGLKEHSPKEPIEGGMLTVWDTPLLIGGNYIVVGGKVPLLPFFPFYLDTMVFAVDDQNYLFEGDDFYFQTKDGVSMKITISVTGVADIDDLLDYRQSGGNMKAIMDQFREIFFTKTQAIVRTIPALEVKTEGEKIAKQLKTDIFEGEAIGLFIKRIQIIPFLPKDLEDSMLKVIKETYQQISESKDYGTLTIAAKAMQKESARQFIPELDDLDPKKQAQEISKLVRDKLILTIDEYTERVMRAKLIEQGNTTGIEGGAKITPIVVPNAGGEK
jgi:hypothetical protein